MAVKKIHNERLFTDFIGVCKQLRGTLESSTDEYEDTRLSFEDAMNKEHDNYTCRTPKKDEFTYSEYEEEVEKKGDANITLGILGRTLCHAQSIELSGNRIIAVGYSDSCRPRDPVEEKMDKLIRVDFFVE